MKIFWGLLVFGIIVAGFFSIKPSTPPSLPPQPSSTLPQSQNNQTVDFTATFTIITNGVTRNFNSAMYHNRSADVYIEATNPEMVHVKKVGVTWNDFFQTLPFSLTKECLTTGIKETFCTGETGTLRFYLNDIENPNLLDMEIKTDDHARIQFAKITTRRDQIKYNYIFYKDYPVPNLFAALARARSASISRSRDTALVSNESSKFRVTAATSSTAL